MNAVRASPDNAGSQRVEIRGRIDIDGVGQVAALDATSVCSGENGTCTLPGDRRGLAPHGSLEGNRVAGFASVGRTQRDDPWYAR